MKYFHINSYFAHPENLLVCGLLCPISTNEIKEKCLKMLLKIRHTVRPQTDTIRQFFTLLPNETNPDADNIFDFINWDEPSLQNKLTFPPLLMKYSDDDLRNGLIDLSDLLCHSQHVERAVKQTSKSVAKSRDYLKQKSDIVCTIDSREKYPQNAPKDNFRRHLQF